MPCRSTNGSPARLRTSTNSVSATGTPRGDGEPALGRVVGDDDVRPGGRHGREHPDDAAPALADACRGCDCAPDSGVSMTGPASVYMVLRHWVNAWSGRTTSRGTRRPSSPRPMRAEIEAAPGVAVAAVRAAQAHPVVQRLLDQVAVLRLLPVDQVQRIDRQQVRVVPVGLRERHAGADHEPVRVHRVRRRASPAPRASSAPAGRRCRAARPSRAASGSPSGSAPGRSCSRGALRRTRARR